MRTSRKKTFARGFNTSVAYVNWLGRCFILFLAICLFAFIQASHPSSQSGSSTSVSRTVVLASADPSCVVDPKILNIAEIDSSSPSATIPDHVHEFDQKNIPLPKYPSSKLLLVSATSNNTYEREIAQRYTFGRIYDIRFIPWDEYPHCVLCKKEDQKDRCHCPSFAKKCRSLIWFHRNNGWWCHTRKELFSIMTALKEWKGAELPEWLHLLDDNTFVNPISLTLFIENLDPDKPYFIGDTMFDGGIVAGGAGKLFSRATLKRLIDRPLKPTVTYHWKNGTHKVKVKSQLESCLARMQGGDWCYYHGDWGVADCVKEVGVLSSDVGGRQHTAFFTQVYEPKRKGGASSWFNLKVRDISNILHHTHAAAFHSKTVEEMYDTFYNIVVPFYQSLEKAYEEPQKTT